MSTQTIALIELRDELKDFRVEVSRSADGFDFDRFFETAERCTVVKRNDRRQVYCIQAHGQNFFLKRVTLVRPKDRLRLTLLPNRRGAEWRNLHRLAAMGVAAPQPLARGQERRHRVPQIFVLTSEIKGRPPVLDGRADWHRLGRFLAFLHRKGIYHSDLHPGNLRLTAKENCALLDVQSVFFLKSLPRFLRRRNIGRLLMHCPPEQNPLAWWNAFLGGYNRDSSSPMRLQDLVTAADRQLERRYRSRTRRCCKNSSEFMRVGGSGLRGYQRRDFNWGLVEIQEAVSQGRQLKPGSVFALEGVCVKRQRLRLLHRNRCRNSWIMSRALEVRDIAAPRALAYLAVGNSRFFVSEYLGSGLLLNDYLSGLTAGDEKRRALQKLANWIRHIHARRVWQRDFKSSNILFHNGQYHMLDLDSVRIKTLSTAQKIINLAQLNASVGPAVTLKDRLRFFHFYITGAHWPRGRRREAYQRIWEISRGKNTAMYGLDLDKLKPKQKEFLNS